MQTEAVTIMALRVIAGVIFYAFSLVGTMKGAEFTASNSVVYKDGQPFPFIMDCTWTTPRSANFLSYWAQLGGTVHLAGSASSNEIALAGSAGLYTIVSLGIENAGAYLASHPEAEMLGVNSNRLGRVYASFVDEGYRAYLTNRLYSVASQLKDNPWFCGYYLQDEFSYPSGADYNTNTIAVFRDKMMEQYGTIGALNQAWCTNYLTKADIQPPPPGQTQTRPNLPSVVITGRRSADWQWFLRWAYLDFLRVVSQTIKEADPKHLIINSMDWWAQNGYKNPTAWWEVPNHVDMLCRHGAGHGLAYNLLLIRQISEWSGKPGMALRMPPGYSVPFIEFRTLFDSARAGFSYVCPAGPESAVQYSGPADSDDNFRRREPQYTTGKSIIQLRKILNDHYYSVSKRLPSRVGFFLGERTACTAGNINTLAIGFLNMLEDMNIDYDILSEYNYAPLNRYDALIIGPGIQLASSNLVNAVKSFQAGGKSLVLLPYAFERTESNEVAAISRFPLNQRFTNMVSAAGSSNVTVNGTTVSLYPKSSYPYSTLSHISVNPGDTVVARTTNGIPCGVITGNGKVLILGWELGIAYGHGTSMSGITYDYGGTTGPQSNLFASIYETNRNSLLTHETCVALEPEKEAVYLIRDFLASNGILPCITVAGYEAPGAIDAERFIVTNAASGSNMLVGIANRLVKPRQSLITTGWDMEKYQKGVWPQDYHIPISNAAVAVEVPTNFPVQIWAWQMPNTEVNGISVSAVPKQYPVNVVVTNGRKVARFTVPVIYDWRAFILAPALDRPLMGIQLSDRRVFGGQSCTATVSILNSTDHPLSGKLYLKDVHGLGAPTNSFSFSNLAPRAATNAAIAVTVNPSVQGGYYSLQAVAGLAGSTNDSADVELQVPGDKTVVNWPLNEGSNCFVRDLSGNLNHGALNLGTGGNTNPANAWVDGRIKAGIYFDGTDDFIDHSGDNLVGGLTKMSIAAWIFPEMNHVNIVRTDGDAMLLHAHTNGSVGFSLKGEDGTGSGYIYYKANAIKLAEWNYIVGAWDGNKMRLYVNGILQGEKVFTGGASGKLKSGAYFRVGSSYGTEQAFQGKMDEIKIYACALSEDEIQQGYFAGSKVGEWEFDEGSGGIAKDTSGNGFDGTLVNMNTNACWTNGVSGGALKFDGSNDYVNCGDAPKMKGMQELTVEAWIKGDSYKQYSGILSKWVWNRQQHYNLGSFQNGSSSKLGKFNFSVSQQLTTGASDSLQSQTNLDLNTWYHIAGVFKGGQYLKLYVNGVLNTNKATTIAHIASGSLPTWIGQYACYAFDGQIDEVKVYNRALSDEEIQQEYSSGIKVGEWKFDEGSGGIAKDTSGNGFDGTLVNMNTNACWTNGVSGGALKFDGSNDYVNCGDAPKMKGMQELTVEAWIKGDSYKQYSGILSKWAWNSQQHYNLGSFQNGSSSKLGKFNFSVSQQLTTGASDSLQSQTNLDLNTWYHIAGVFKGGQYLKLYVNGVLNTNKTTSIAHIASGSLPTWIGQYACYAFDGQIDEVRVYARALSDEEIQQEYSSGIKVGEWKFDEGEGGVAHDTSGNGFDGMLTNMNTNACWTNGVSGGALKFDGFNDYVDCGDDLKFKGMPELTVEAWVKGNSYKIYAGVLSKWAWNRQQHYNLGYFQNGSSSKLGKFNFGVSQQLTTGASDTIQSQTNLDLNTWYHIAGVFKGGQYLKLYVNGVLNTNKTTTIAHIASGSLPTWIGQYACYAFDGQIDEVRVYAKALSDTEIQQDYLADKAGSMKGVLGGEHSDSGSPIQATEETPDSNSMADDALPAGTLANQDAYSVFAADFDGDQMADPVIYCQTNGNWRVRLSGNDYVQVELKAYLGGPGYAALAADFDGDQLADPCVYQGTCASSASWLVRLSAAEYNMVSLVDFLGGSNYVALAGDFDGDRLADPCVCDVLAGTWVVKLSSAGYMAVTEYELLGGKDCTALAADFDGDGYGDAAVYDDSTGCWMALLSSNGYEAALLDTSFGGLGWKALTADFDGDNYAEPAVYSPSTAEWLIRPSSLDYEPAFPAFSPF